MLYCAPSAPEHRRHDLRPRLLVAERAEHERRPDVGERQQLRDAVAEPSGTTTCPASVLSTISAKTICRPRPQATVVQVDRAAVGGHQRRRSRGSPPAPTSACAARRRRTARGAPRRPRRPARRQRSTNSSRRERRTRSSAARRLARSVSSAVGHAPRPRPDAAPGARAASGPLDRRLHPLTPPDQRQQRRRLVGDLDRPPSQLGRARSPPRVGSAARRAGRRRDLVARLRQDIRADRRVDRVVDAVAPGAERHRRAPDELGVERGQEARARRRDDVARRRRRQQAVVVHRRAGRRPGAR